MIEQIRAAIARVGWSETARRSGVDRVTLHRCFGNSGNQNPKLATIEAVLPHVGLRLAVTEIDQ